MLRSISDCAAAWNVSITTVRKWITQGRLRTQRVGKRGVLILDEERPAPVTPGELQGAGAGWNYGKRYRPGGHSAANGTPGPLEDASPAEQVLPLPVDSAKDATGA